jgi:hypothetical protein
MFFFQKLFWKHIMCECTDNYVFLIFFWYLKICFQTMCTILCHSCQWHECLVHNFLHIYVIFKAKSNTFLSLHLCELLDRPTIHALLWSSLLYFLNQFFTLPYVHFMHLRNPQMLVYLSSWKALFCKENSGVFIEKDFSSICV